MTPKEKADKLCMMFLMHTNTKDREYDINKELAKQCALIAVDEILKDNPFDVIKLQYWGKVKQEIDEL